MVVLHTYRCVKCGNTEYSGREDNHLMVEHEIVECEECMTKRIERDNNLFEDLYDILGCDDIADGVTLEPKIVGELIRRIIEYIDKRETALVMGGSK